MCIFNNLDVKLTGDWLKSGEKKTAMVRAYDGKLIAFIHNIRVCRCTFQSSSFVLESCHFVVRHCNFIELSVNELKVLAAAVCAVRTSVFSDLRLQI